MRNIGNHLEVNPKAKIVVVTHSRGVDFLFDGAKDKNGNPYNIPVEKLKAQGVQFDVCSITLRNRKLEQEQVRPGGDLCAVRRSGDYAARSNVRVTPTCVRKRVSSARKGRPGPPLFSASIVLRVTVPAKSGSGVFGEVHRARDARSLVGQQVFLAKPRAEAGSLEQ